MKAISVLLLGALTVSLCSRASGRATRPDGRGGLSLKSVPTNELEEDWGEDRSSEPRGSSDRWPPNRRPWRRQPSRDRNWYGSDSLEAAFDELESLDDWDPPAARRRQPPAAARQDPQPNSPAEPSMWVIPRNEVPETPSEPRLPLTSIIEPLIGSQQSADPQDSFVLAKICGGHYYCRVGDQGPCPANQVFLAAQTAQDQSRLTCHDGKHLWNHGCYLARVPDHVTSASFIGYCSSPCAAKPATFRYSAKTRQCYNALPPHANLWENAAEFRGPCPHGQVFVDADGVQGQCRCAKRDHLMWDETGTCHHVYSQGPCSLGEWLVPNGGSSAVCIRSPCPYQADGKHLFVTGYGYLGCYQTYTQGPCPFGYLFVVDDFINGVSRCAYQQPFIFQ